MTRLIDSFPLFLLLSLSQSAKMADGLRVDVCFVQFVRRSACRFRSAARFELAVVGAQEGNYKNVLFLCSFKENRDHYVLRV